MQGIQLVLDQVNREGGINGTPLRVVFEDTRGEARQAVTVFQKLHELDGACLVLGDIMSATTLATVPSADSAQTPLIAIGASAPALTGAGPYVYRVWPSDLYEGRVSGAWAAGAGYRKAAIVYINNEFGVGLRNAFKAEFQARGGSIVDEEGFEADTRTFRDVAAKLKGVASDLVYIVGYYENTALMIKSLREVGVTTPLLGTTSAMDPKVTELAGSAAEGFLVAVVNDVDEDHLTPVQQRFFDDYKNRFRQRPDWAAVKAADALLIGVQCLRSGAKSGPEIKAEIDAVRTFTGISGQITFDKYGDVSDKPVVIRRLHDGKFVLFATPDAKL